MSLTERGGAYCAATGGTWPVAMPMPATTTSAVIRIRGTPGAKRPDR
jgi:hypothetical protein